MGIISDRSIDVVLYDFGVPQRLGRDAISGLRRIHGDVARDVDQVLSGVFEADVRGTVVSLEQSRYQSFIDGLPPGAFHCIIGSDELDGEFEIVFPARTALRIVDQVLGTSATGDRPLTLIDARLLEDLIPSVLTSVMSAFTVAHPINLEFQRSEVNNQVVKLVPGDDIVVIIELLFTLGDDDLALTFCYPQKAITPILSSLSAIEQAAASEALARSSPIRRSILRVSVPVIVQLPSTWLSPVEVEELKVGDVLKTGVAADTPPILTIAGRPALRVRPTTRRTRVACAVVGPLSEIQGVDHL
ncbi:MAG: FliM/FliN family flagellar motor switch protein [Actinomycetota bacterium]